MRRVTLLAILLAACAGSDADRRFESVAERRQIFRDEVEHIKAPLHPIEHNQNDQHYDSKPVYDDYYQGDYRPSYQRPQKPSYDAYPAKPYRPQEYEAYERPASKPVKPYKPPPSYPKEVVLLQPSAALKPAAYADKYVTPGYKPSAIPGTPGRDYPNYSAVPDTAFDCLSFKNLDYGYMYPDKEAGCQVFHACHADGRQDSFLCPLGTIFDLDTQTCDWWYNVKCY